MVRGLIDYKMSRDVSKQIDVEGLMTLPEC